MVAASATKNPALRRDGAKSIKQIQTDAVQIIDSALNRYVIKLVFGALRLSYREYKPMTRDRVKAAGKK
jgi:hypothetical protein